MRAIGLVGVGLACAVVVGVGCAALIGLDAPEVVTACINGPDQAALGKHASAFLADVASCTVGSIDNPSAASACLQTTDGLSPPCADCFAAAGVCANRSCASVCAAGAAKLACQTCVAASCNASLVACGGTPIFACLDMPDMAATYAHQTTLNMDVQACGLANSTYGAAVVSCIQQHDGLSETCATCWAEESLCAATQCKTSCVNDPTSMACGTCVAAQCGPTFAICSGLFPDGGFDAGGPG